MTVRNKLGDLKITFLGKDFSIKSLEQAFAKSVDSYIEPGKEISEHRFDPETLGIGWAETFKKPILTLHEGKYVIIMMDDELLNSSTHLVEQNGVTKRIVVKGFKAKFVTKYNFNQAKVLEPLTFPEPIRPEPPTSEQRRAFSNQRPGSWQPNNGFSKHQGGGYKK
jgi:hypothetical protein